MSSPSTIPPRSSVRTALGLPWGDYTRHDGVALPRSPQGAVNTQNINYGSGILNNVAGNQIFSMNIAFNVQGKPAFQHNDTFSLIEPYQSAVDSLFRIIPLLDRFPPNPSISMLREEVGGFVPVLTCVAKAMEIIRRAFPQFSTHTFFTSMDSQAIECGMRLKELKADVYEYSVHIDDILLSSRIRQIFLLVFPPHRWRPLSRRIRECIQANQTLLEQFLHLLVNPTWRRILGEEHAELRHLITTAGLTSETTIRHLNVQTIWIREPAGTNFYAIPLTLCGSWRDFGLVVYQYFKHGPEGSYIRRGSWELVHVDENRAIDESSFTSMLKPEATFDIGIILQLIAKSPCTCPQCGHDNSCTAADVWVSCLNPECASMFRSVLNTTTHSFNTSDYLDGEVPRPYARTNFRRVSARVRVASDQYVDRTTSTFDYAICVRCRQAFKRYFKDIGDGDILLVSSSTCIYHSGEMDYPSSTWSCCARGLSAPGCYSSPQHWSS